MSTEIKQSLKSQTLLLLDASTSVVQVGILYNGNWLAFCENKNESLNAIFIDTAKCLKKAQISMSQINGFLICEGPGSVLGLRLIIMAIKTWQSVLLPQPSKVYLYRNLEIAAQLLLMQNVSPPFHLISAFKKNIWNLITIKNHSNIQNLKPVNTQSLKILSDPVWYIRQRKDVYPPRRVREFKYSLKLLPLLNKPYSFFHEIDDISKINIGKVDFPKWKNERHRKIN